jgi:hypothetical protein
VPLPASSLEDLESGRASGGFPSESQLRAGLVNHRLMGIPLRGSVRFGLYSGEKTRISKSGLPPVVDENTEILILGTLPSDKSLAAKQGAYTAL